jgi:hypothetical protein
METVERTLFREKIITSKIDAKLYRCETTWNHIPWCEIDVEDNNKVNAITINVVGGSKTIEVQDIEEVK